jgi:acyl-CoA synthetase (AMP-forming)/AMP-acid ligase II
MGKQFQMRQPAPELMERYREMGYWTDQTLTQWLDEGLLAHPDQIYRIWSDERPFQGTFRDVRDRSLRLAARFAEMGIGPGDVVSFQLPNWIECVETFLATLYVGAISLPVVHIYGAKEMKFVLAEVEAKLHVTTSRFRHLNYRETLEAMRPELPALETVIYIDEQYDQLLDTVPLAGIRVVDPDTPSVLGYTSGTTSNPKGVIHTHRTMVAEMLQRIMREPGDERPLPLTPPEGFNHWLVGSPVGHVSGLQIGVFVPILFNRPAHLMDRWELDTVLDTLVEENLHLGAAANFFFNSVITHPKFDPAIHLDHMRYIASGGAPVPRAFGEQCHAMGISLVRGYGSTEHPSVTGSAFDDPLEKRISTDGRALGGVEIQIRDEDGTVLPRGTAGEIHTRGPELFVGYVDTAHNEGAFDADGWFCTGDVGILDEEGFLAITDRTKDIIIRGGENISAAEVEDALCRMPMVIETAAVAAPDERMGEHVCAFIRIAGDARAPTLADIRAHLAEIGLARQKWPEEIHVVADFDRTAAGKIKKFVLRDALRADAEKPPARATA